jgi:hypothetical protein
VEAISESRGCTKLSGFGLDHYNSQYFPSFYFFDAIWDNPKGGVIIDHPEVDRRTGNI